MTLFTPADFAVVADLPLAPFEPAKLAMADDDFPDDIFSTLARRVPDNSISNIGHTTAVNDTANQNVYNLTIFEALVLLHTPPTYTDAGRQYQLLTQLSARTHAACQRLIIEELTAHQLSLLYRRQ